MLDCSLSDKIAQRAKNEHTHFKPLLDMACGVYTVQYPGGC